MELPCRRLADGLELRVRARPKAARDGIDGCVADAQGEWWLAVRVTAPPDDGKANAAILRLLGKRMGVAVSRLTLLAGAAARWKRIRVEGQPDELAASLAAMAGHSQLGESKE
ncbi:DUF167 family protein [Marinimicrococcus flavescens]|uniref:UPF0235 protein PZ740_02120 n=1 Tax=Marinimicrococcus flavescens TaxID=3031815 RepID=A0AAP3XPH6_9PROT|nr:DUF167 family protein [Marinimicrococcus flavescens]